MNTKEKKASKKQKKLARALVAEDTTKEAAKKAGYTSLSHVSALKRKPYFQEEMVRAEEKQSVALEKKGIDEDYIAGRIKKGLKATYVKKDGGKKYQDYHAQHKFTDMALKIKGGYAPSKLDIRERQEKLILHVTPEVIKGLKDAKAITDDEADVIEAEIIEEESEEQEDTK